VPWQGSKALLPRCYYRAAIGTPPLPFCPINTPPQCQHAWREKEKKKERQRELIKEKREQHELKRGKRTKEGKKTGKAINRRGIVRVRREGKRIEREKKELTERDN